MRPGRERLVPSTTGSLGRRHKTPKQRASPWRNVAVQQSSRGTLPDTLGSSRSTVETWRSATKAVHDRDSVASRHVSRCIDERAVCPPTTSSTEVRRCVVRMGILHSALEFSWDGSASRSKPVCPTVSRTVPENCPTRASVEGWRISLVGTIRLCFTGG